MQNPFSSPLSITEIQSNVTARGIFVGSINTQTQFNAAGSSVTNSPALPLDLNLYPPAIFALTRELVVEAGLDPVYLDGIVQLGGYTYLPTTGPGTRKRDQLYYGGAETEADLLVAAGKLASLPGTYEADELAFPEAPARPRLAKRNLYTGFNLPNYVDAAFKKLAVNVDLVSTVTIGQYTTQLTYSQQQVPTITDSTLNLLLPVLAGPIVQKIVDGSVLGITGVTISDPTNNAFRTGLQGSITNAGPFDAVIQFPNGLTVAWDGQPLGQIAMPDVSLVGDIGATLNLNAQFAVASVDRLTQFTKYLLNTPSFTWQIYGTGLSVNALGISVPSVSIQKEVLLAGSNGLKGDVIINHFDLPANDPAGGITLTLDTTVTNPGSIGVQLSQLGFQVRMGPVDAALTGAELLLDHEHWSGSSHGRLYAPCERHDRSPVAGSPHPADRPRPAGRLDHLQRLHSRPAGARDRRWRLRWPFGLRLAERGYQVAQDPRRSARGAQPADHHRDQHPVALALLHHEHGLGPAVLDAGDDGRVHVAVCLPDRLDGRFGRLHLGLPGHRLCRAQCADRERADRRRRPSGHDRVPERAVRGVRVRPELLRLSDARSNEHPVFSQFLTDTTDDQSISFQLSGSVDSVASTAIGSLNINAIAFSVTTSLLGLQGLNAQPAYVTECVGSVSLTDLAASTCSTATRRTCRSTSTRICTTRRTSRSAPATSPST